MVNSNRASQLTPEEIQSWKNNGTNIISFFLANFPDVMSSLGDSSNEFLNLCEQVFKTVVESYIPTTTNPSANLPLINDILQISGNSSLVLTQITNDIRALSNQVNLLQAALSQVVVINPIKPPSSKTAKTSRLIFNYSANDFFHISRCTPTILVTQTTRHRYAS